LYEAEDWPATHSLLINRFAAKWFLGTAEERQRLRSMLLQLQLHEAEVDDSLGSGTYREGAGLYTSHFNLKVTQIS
jgi:hypothetical protein